MEIGIETAFTPWASLFGGVLIGLSAVMVMALFGRIAGIAGITQGAMALPGAAKDSDWRWAFLAGLVLAPLAVTVLGGTVEQTVPDNLGGMALAGLLVGQVPMVLAAHRRQGLRLEAVLREGGWATMVLRS